MATKTKDKKQSTKNVHQNHRERVKTKFKNFGLDAFAPHEALELLLFYSIPQADTNPIAHALLNKFGNMRNIFDASIDSLTSVSGIGEHTAILIKMIPQIMQMYNKDKTRKIKKLENQIIAQEFVCNLFEGISTEEFYIICLKEDNSIITYKKETSGNFNKVEIQIRSFTDYVLKSNCSKVIIAHNHPDTTSKPSDDDVVMTHKLCSSCLLNEIDLIDHIIYSAKGTYSFAEHGIMRDIKHDILSQLKYTEETLPLKQFSTSSEDYVIILPNDAYTFTTTITKDE